MSSSSTAWRSSTVWVATGRLWRVCGRRTRSFRRTYQEAGGESAELIAKGGHAPSLAFIAMAHYRLGQPDKAKAVLERLRTTMKLPPWATKQEVQSLFREAEAVIGTGPVWTEK